MLIVWIVLIGVGVGLIVWGAEAFAEHLGVAAVQLRVSSFALALLLAGAEPEELATAIAASVRNAPAIAFGDVVGANIAICLVAIGVGAIVTPLPFTQRVMRYALLAVPIGGLAVAMIWDGSVDRPEGLLLIGLYALYVVSIWRVERRPPALGETGELEEAIEAQPQGRDRLSQDLLMVFLGVGGMIFGSILLVEAVRQISSVEATQTKLALTLIGFATAFELVVLAWSMGRRGATEATMAGVVGSFAYNVTMTLGAAAIVRPLTISDASLLHLPLVVMLGSLLLVIGLATIDRPLGKRSGVILIAAYVLFVALTLMR